MTKCFYVPSKHKIFLMLKDGVFWTNLEEFCLKCFLAFQMVYLQQLKLKSIYRNNLIYIQKILHSMPIFASEFRFKLEICLLELICRKTDDALTRF